MRKHLRTISVTGLAISLLVSSACTDCGPRRKKPKGIVAIVYSDLTQSINDQTAIKQKDNIQELFQNLPVNSKFFLSSIDRGSTTPPIYEFAPNIPDHGNSNVEDEANKKTAEILDEKKATERNRLNSSLDSYHTSIAKQQGLVSCISNKLNSLLDTVRNQKRSYKDYEIRVFFYSDMIEECGNSFDGYELKLRRLSTDTEDEKNLQNIKTRIERNFQQAAPEENLKSLGAKVYIVLTSQDDKLSPNSIKTIWSIFFAKLGLEPKDLVWANGNQPFFWELEK